MLGWVPQRAEGVARRSATFASAFGQVGFSDAAIVMRPNRSLKLIGDLDDHTIGVVLERPRFRQESVKLHYPRFVVHLLAV